MSGSIQEGKAFPEGAAIVIGGSGGVGREICIRLASRGVDVVLTYFRNRTEAEHTADAVRSLGRAADVQALSLEDATAVRALVESVRARAGPVHTVVNAAGTDIRMKFVNEVAPDEWRTAVSGEVNGFFNLVHATLPALRECGGSLVAVTSAGQRRYPARDILSVAPKAAIEAVVRAIAAEEGRYGVRANCVALGVIETGIFLRLKKSDVKADWIEAARRNTALKRFGTAGEAAEVVVFLASSRAAYVTGQTIYVDGGYSI